MPPTVQGLGTETRGIFTTDRAIIKPTLTTNTVGSVTPTTAVSGGNITSDGNATVTARGVCWSTSSDPTTNDPHTTDGIGTGSFESSITGLTPNTTYYVKAYATNSAGTGYGNQRIFTTDRAIIKPTLTTNTVSGVTQTTAESGGTVTSDGNGTVTARGVCWSTSSDPTTNDPHTTDGIGTGSFESSITGLTPNTTYYVKAYATNSAGTGYGNQRFFTTDDIPDNIVTDYEGNEYQTVVIGNQTWMAENLRSTRYANGAYIQEVQTSNDWANLGVSDKAYCWYNNSTSTGLIYGALYTWAAAMNGSSSSSSNPSQVQGVCPGGWHLPSDEEWKQLEMHLGMSRIQADAEEFRGTNEGGKLKSVETDLWLAPNYGASNESGFGAIPGGFRHYSGPFNNIGEGAYFHSSTQNASTNAWNRRLAYDLSSIYRGDYRKGSGFSVRCVKN